MQYLMQHLQKEALLDGLRLSLALKEKPVQSQTQTNLGLDNVDVAMERKVLLTWYAVSCTASLGWGTVRWAASSLRSLDSPPECRSE
jgi:hypothetical protein